MSDRPLPAASAARGLSIFDPQQSLPLVHRGLDLLSRSQPPASSIFPNGEMDFVYMPETKSIIALEWRSSQELKWLAYDLSDALPQMTWWGHGFRFPDVSADADIGQVRSIEAKISQHHLIVKALFDRPADEYSIAVHHVFTRAGTYLYSFGKQRDAAQLDPFATTHQQTWKYVDQSLFIGVTHNKLVFLSTRDHRSGIWTTNFELGDEELVWSGAERSVYYSPFSSAGTDEVWLQAKVQPDQFSLDPVVLPKGRTDAPIVIPHLEQLFTMPLQPGEFFESMADGIYHAFDHTSLPTRRLLLKRHIYKMSDASKGAGEIVHRGDRILAPGRYWFEGAGMAFIVLACDQAGGYRLISATRSESRAYQYVCGFDGNLVYTRTHDNEVLIHDLAGRLVYQQMFALSPD